MARCSLSLLCCSQLAARPGVHLRAAAAATRVPTSNTVVCVPRPRLPVLPTLATLSLPTGRREFVAPQPFFSFHHANAFETADGKVVLDTVANLDGVDFSANFEVRSVN